MKHYTFNLNKMGVYFAFWELTYVLPFPSGIFSLLKCVMCLFTSDVWDVQNNVVRCQGLTVQMERYKE